MESPRLKRRAVWENKVYTLSLCEELIVLLSSRSEFKFMGNRLSLCLRICLLAELELAGCIYTDDKIVVANSAQIDNKLLNAIHQSIYRTGYTPLELVLGLNGELTDDDIQIRMLRRHFYKLLEEKKIIKCEKSKFVFNKIKITNYNVQGEVFDNLVTYLINESGSVDVRYDVLVICLHYCKGTDRLLTNLTENKAKLVYRRIERIIDRYRNRSKTIVETILSHLICKIT